MAQIFVSHSSADNPLALRVRECLGDLGYDSVFLDVSPTDGLVPGAAWRDQLFTNLDRSDALVFIGTPTANASLWCHSELALARWLRKPILSLLFDGVDPHELVADIQGVNLSSADLSPDLVRPGLVALGLEQATRWDATRSPFPGLRPFDESYAPVFFGRERQIAELRQLVDPPSRARQGIVVPVLGPSGSGKSSLVRAGLVAALRPAPDWVVSDPWTPSDAPLAELGLALSHAAKRAETALDADECSAMLGRPGGIADYLRRLREAGSVPADARLLVVIDQAEELVTLTGEAERKAFFEALALSCTPPSPLRVVMTARTDMWDAVSALTTRFGMTVAPAVLHVPPLSRADLARVIAEPAKRSHLTLEDGLLQRLVEDTESGDALPLLAFTLSRMAADATDGQLTHARYDAVGGVRGAIASRAAEVAHGARTEAEVASAILQIVGTGDNRPVTRLARLDSVPAAQREILDDLVDARLVVVRESAGQQVYAPAHEALFSAWPPLAEMISRRHDDLRLRSRLERRAADWREAGSGGSGLLSGTELEQAADWERRSSDLHTPEITPYVAASQQRARRARLLKTGIAAVVAALAVALVAVLLVNTRADQRRADQARATRLVAIAQREYLSDPSVEQVPELQALQAAHDPAAAAVALIEGLHREPGNATLSRLADALIKAPARDVVFPSAARQPLLGLAVGSRLALATQSGGDSVLWDTATGTLRGTLPATASAAIRPDDRIAVVSTPKGAQVWDVGSAKPSALATFGATPTKLAFSPDGARLAVAAGTVLELWDLSDPSAPRQVTVWRTPATGIDALAVLADGLVLVAGDEHTLTAWDPAEAGDDSVRLVVAEPPGYSATSIDVDAAGTRALLAGPTVTGALVVDLDSGATIGTFTAGDPASDKTQLPTITWTAAMDSSGSTVTAVDLNGRAYVFDVGSGRLQAVLAGGHTGVVNDAAVTATGLVLTAGFEGQLRAWDPVAAQSGPTGSRADALCSVFGPRIDEASWRLAMGAVAFQSPCGAGESAPPPPALTVADPGRDLPVPVLPPLGSTLLRDDFEGGRTRLALGSDGIGSGRLSRRLVEGRYRMSVTGAGVDYRTWQPVRLDFPADAAQVAVRISPVSGVGGCGLTLGDGAHQVVLNVAADGQGSLTWYATSGSTATNAGQLAFSAAATSTARDVALVDDSGMLTVLVGGEEVAQARDDSLQRPVEAGVATFGDTVSCDFDDLVVRTP